MSATVFIAKNVKIAVEAITTYLSQNEFEIIGTTPNAKVAIDQIKKLHPDIALIGCELDNGTNIEVIQQLQDLKPQTYFVLYTLNGTAPDILEAYQLGVDGYIHTTTTLDELLTCLRWVMKDKKYLCQTLRNNLSNDNSPELVAAKTLSNREREVLTLIAEEKSNKEIAEKLFLSPETVNNHRRNIRQKLQFEGGKTVMKRYAQYVENYYRLQQIREQLEF